MNNVKSLDESTSGGACPRRDKLGGSLSRYVRGALQGLTLALLMAGSLSCYLLVLRWRGPSGASRVTWVPWDDWFPFEPAWAWAYLLPYPIGPVLAGLLRPDVFSWFVRRALVLVFVSLIVFIVWPTQTAPRLSVTLPEGPTASLYRMMVEIDEPPANAAPSLHVSLTCLLALALARNDWRWAVPAFLGAGIVWLATLLTRQHHLIDVGSGALLALLVAVPFGKKQVEEDQAA